jgi:tellurite methyltransferase
MMTMERPITGFELDEEGHWRAVLSCGHKQHVRHKPPLFSRPWVLEESTRKERIGTSLQCKLCDERSIPPGHVLTRQLRFDSTSVPEGLLKEHRLKPGVWGRLRVLKGRALFYGGEEIQEIPAPGGVIIPPEMEHRIELDEGTTIELELHHPPY